MPRTPGGGVPVDLLDDRARVTVKGFATFGDRAALLGGTPTGNEIRLVDHPGSLGALVCV